LWEKVAARPPDEGYLSTERYLSAEATPHPIEFVVGADVALSHRGEGAVIGAGERMDSGDDEKCRSNTMN
jgi:hypothetical protein